MDDEKKLEKYLKRGYSKRLCMISIGSQTAPKTILKYAKELKKFVN